MSWHTRVLRLLLVEWFQSTLLLLLLLLLQLQRRVQLGGHTLLKVEWTSGSMLIGHLLKRVTDLHRQH